jgi:hypothetical protein
VQSHRHQLFKASAIGLLLLSQASSATAQVWTKTSAPNKNWAAVTSSADGNKLAAAFQSGGGIYTSTNAGATWTPTSAPAKPWAAMASSADGKVLLAVVPNPSGPGGIYTSTNYGGTWVSNSVVGNSYQWDAAAASADGHTLIVAGNFSSPVYYSTNTGATWSSNGIPIGYWTSVACSGDGTKLAAATSGTYCFSTNAGVSWSNYLASGSSVLVSSADASHLFLYGSGMLVSTNWGVNWQSAGQPNGAMQMASSSDAKKLVALYSISSVGNVYVSTDFGTTWTASYAPVTAWRAIGLSADGTRMVAVHNSFSDGIYVWQPPALGVTNAAGSLVFSWPTNGTAFSLQANPDLATTNWAAVTNLPTITNSQQQVIVSPSESRGFFRLMSP